MDRPDARTGEIVMRNGLKCIGILALLAVIAGIGLFAAYPDQTRRVAAVPFRERNGCSFLNAIKAISYTRQHQKVGEQLRERSHVVDTTEDGLCLWATPRGRYWAPKEDSEHFLVLAEMQLGAYALPEAAVRKGDVVLDCGAYLGHFTREALEAGASRVIAIEPGTRQSACLRRTFASEVAAGLVEVVQEGVWSAEGRLQFQDKASPDASFVAAAFLQARSSVARISVPVTTIDALARRLNLPRIDLIKMDIEGSEQEALRGAVRTLAEFKPRLAVAGYHKATDPDAIPAIVRRANAGYRFVSAGCRLDLEEIRPLTLFFH